MITDNAAEFTRSMKQLEALVRLMRNEGVSKFSAGSLSVEMDAMPQPATQAELEAQELAADEYIPTLKRSKAE